MFNKEKTQKLPSQRKQPDENKHKKRVPPLCHCGVTNQRDVIPPHSSHLAKSQKPDGVLDSLEQGITDGRSCEPPCGCQELIPGPLQE